MERNKNIKNKITSIIVFSFIGLFTYSSLIASQDELLKDVKTMMRLEGDNTLYLQEYKNKIVAKRVSYELTAYSASKVGASSSDYCSILIKSAEGQVIAGVVAQINQGGYTGDTCKLYFLWVDPACRHHGLGSAIMYELERYAQIRNCFDISIDFKNDQEHRFLQSFFEKFGFITEDITTSSVADKSPCMSKVIVSDAIDFQPVLHDKVLVIDGNEYHLSIESKVAPELKSKYVEFYSTGIAPTSHEFFTVFMTSPTEEIIAGAIGQIKFIDGIRFCKVDEFWVDEACRGQNLGTKIMDQIITYARSKSCEFIKLYTLDFLARGFYEKQGFVVIATFPKTASPHSYEYYMLRKIL